MEKAHLRLVALRAVGLAASSCGPLIPPPTTMAAANPTSDLPNGSSAQDRKKSRESDRRRRRRKQKKNKAASSNAADAEPDEEPAPDENADPKPQVEVEVEYVPEKAELDDALLADFKDIFDKFTFKDSSAAAELQRRMKIAARRG